MAGKGSPVEASVASILTVLEAERASLRARVEALDLAIVNLARVYGLGKQATAQTRPAGKATTEKPPRVPKAPGTSDSDAGARREECLSAIRRAGDVGLTVGALKRQTPKLTGPARSNALQQLKHTQQIRRAGNAWVAV